MYIVPKTFVPRLSLVEIAVLRARLLSLLHNRIQSFLTKQSSNLLGRMSADNSNLQNHPKWGFSIYRCDYRNDSVWAQFIDRWTQWVNDWLIRHGDRELIENLAWTIVEDHTALDGATVEDVRSLFTAWTRTEEAITEQQNAVDSYVLGSPRVQFCVHVDAKALDECLRFDGLPEDT